MTWQPELDDLARRRELVARLGGDERVDRHRASGRLTCRERIAAFLDPGSFRELGSATGKATYDSNGALIDLTPANFVMGRGTIDGRPLMVGADDFTVRGGHADGAIWKKQVYGEQLARHLRIPMVRLIDGSSGGGSVATYEETGRTYVPPLPGFADQVKMLSEVPVVAIVAGPAVGLGAARAAMTHFTVMVKEVGQVFVAGPPVVAYATFEEVDKEQLGGHGIHGLNGTVDNLASSEEDAFDQVRRFLSYLPSSVWETAPLDVVMAPEPNIDLLSLMPRDRHQPHDPHLLIEALVDSETFFEIGGGWGPGTVTGVARLNGIPVAITTSDPTVWGGALTAGGADKLRRLVDLADTFHLPVVSLVDQPGFAIGVAAEKAGTIRRGASLIAALYQTDIPWFTVIVRRAFGVAGAALVDRGEPDVRVAWPSADWGSLPLEGGIEAAFRRQLESAPDRDALRQEIGERFEALRSPLRTAETFDIEEIIDPRETRAVLIEWLTLVARNLPSRLGTRGHGYRP